MNNVTPNVTGANSPRFITLRLRLPVFITAVVLLFTGIIWIFILGVIVGRGYNTQEKIGALSAIIPEPPVAENTDANVPGLSGISGTSVTEAGKSDEAALDTLFQDDSLLKKENLRFKDELKTPYVQTVPPLAAVAQTVRPETTASANTANARPAADADTGQVYEYLFQVSSFNQINQAEAFTQKLKDSGFSSKVETYKTAQKIWYRVMVTFTGRAAELDAFKNKLKPFNINDPVLHKRKAVS
jgi:cell division septation protein DedD